MCFSEHAVHARESLIDSPVALRIYSVIPSGYKAVLWVACHVYLASATLEGAGLWFGPLRRLYVVLQQAPCTGAFAGDHGGFRETVKYTESLVWQPDRLGGHHENWSVRRG